MHSITAIHLYTYNMTDISSFITEMFDIDIIHDEESYFLLNNTKVVLHQVNGDNGSTHEGRRLFTLSASSIEELHEMRQKLEFYYYREGVPTELFQGNVEFRQDDEDIFLDLKDPDGNIWTLYYSPQTFIAPIESQVFQLTE
jgi:hypothetical protein